MIKIKTLTDFQVEHRYIKKLYLKDIEYKEDYIEFLQDYNIFLIFEVLKNKEKNIYDKILVEEKEKINFLLEQFI